MANIMSSGLTSPAQQIPQQHDFPQDSMDIHHGGMEPSQQMASYSEIFCSSYPSTQSEQTLRYQDELNELMMGNVGKSAISPSAALHQFQWPCKTQYSNSFGSSFDDSEMLSSPQDVLSPFGSYSYSEVASSQGPTSPEALWEIQQGQPHIHQGSVGIMRMHSLTGPYSQRESHITTSQQLNSAQRFDDHQPGNPHAPMLISSQNIQSPDSSISSINPVWAVEQENSSPDIKVNASSPQDCDDFFHTYSWPLSPEISPSNLRAEQDRLIVEGKRMNMSYKEIKEQFNIDGAVSTLRGRYRAATKPKCQRVRKPEWKPEDLELLVQSINMRMGTGKVRKLKNLETVDYLYIPWKVVVQDIWDNGGSYHFGASSAKKKFVELVKADKARGPIRQVFRAASASSETATRPATQAASTAMQTPIYSLRSCTLSSQLTPYMGSPMGSDLTLQTSSYPDAYTASQMDSHSAAQISLHVDPYTTMHSDSLTEDLHPNSVP